MLIRSGLLLDRAAQRSKQRVRFGLGQIHADTEVDAMTERQRIDRVAGHVEAVESEYLRSSRLALPYISNTSNRREPRRLRR